MAPGNTQPEALGLGSEQSAQNTACNSSKRFRQAPVHRASSPLGQVTSSLVSTVQSVAGFVDILRLVPRAAKPALYLDLEGIKLSRNGSISLVIVYVQPKLHAYMIDVHTLQSTAFTTPATGDAKTTFKTLLESPAVHKVFFDVRNDSDALFSHYGIRLAAVQDIQLMENALRPPATRRYLNGLDRCIQLHAHAMTPADKHAWRAAKEKGAALFAPEKGGSYQVFNQRPMSADIQLYCLNDVKILPLLYDEYLGRLNPRWRAEVLNEAKKRVSESQLPLYEPHSPKKRFGPWS